MADVPQQDRNLRLPRTRIGTKWATTYDPILALRIVEQLAEGRTLRQICTEENGMPHPTTFHKWVARCPELKMAYEAAKMLSAYSMEEEAIDTARSVARSPGTSQKVRAAEVLIKQLQWSAAKRDPQTFADRAQGNIVVPITINTSLDLGGGGNSTKDHPDIYSLDVTPVKPDETEIEVAAKELGLPPITNAMSLVPVKVKQPRHLKRVLTPKDPNFKLDLDKRPAPNYAHKRV